MAKAQNSFLLWSQNKQSVVSMNQSVVLVWQQVNHQKQFSTFLKTPKYKIIGCFDKTTSCFSLSLKNTFQLKRFENAYALDIIKSGYIQLIYPRSYLKTAQQQQAHLAFHHPSKGLDSSKLEHTWFNNNE